MFMVLVVDFDIYIYARDKLFRDCENFNLVKAFVSYQTFDVVLSKDVLNERDCSSDEVVGRDGVAVGAGARVDVEGPAVTGGRAHRGWGKGGTVPALALAGFDPLPAGGDVVPVRHGLSHNVGPECGSSGTSASVRPSSSPTRVALLRVKSRLF